MTEPQRDIPAVSPTPLGPPSANGEPRNPTVAFEPKDVNVKVVVWFVTALAAGIAVVLVGLVGFYWWLYREDATKNVAASPVAREVREQARRTDPELMLPPSPRLEGIAPVSKERIPGRVRPSDELQQHDVGRYRPGSAQVLYAEQEQVLAAGWAWLDGDHKAARIPLAEARAKLLAKPGDLLKARAGRGAANRDESEARPSRNSSGRMPREETK
jgi:hypothetical protein